MELCYHLDWIMFLCNLHSTQILTRWVLQIDQTRNWFVLSLLKNYPIGVHFSISLRYCLSDHGQYLNETTFEEGWPFIGRKRVHWHMIFYRRNFTITPLSRQFLTMNYTLYFQDRSDFEWQFWRQMSLQQWPLYIGHIIVGQLCRLWNHQVWL